MGENEVPFASEGFYWEFIDATKDAFSTERWQSMLMDCSKNEMLALVHVYRAGETTMSRVAEYVGVPLNTATGIVTRLEKRGLVQRWRSEQDKRVMVVRITDQGTRQVNAVIEAIGTTVGRVFAGLENEERQVLLKLIGRLPALLQEEAETQKTSRTKKGSMKRIAID
ncbi:MULTISPECIES: MarR family winged helix-turn-helix transcriptional regulator [Gordonibacter]|uniref:MarR family transcriptional regulator n=1 Tax=Gordonibacter faecis TaxID=3047475 RepID=A0ABT7DK57_9ACTN|nr:MULTISPECIES: MarR family transcriptional regulator [unclassified Gordonibacter]MDJ1649914.1 MarR family transcriptional regulator [Gordonibacter sp. KGMB12511]